MMPVRQGKRNKHYNNNNSGGQRVLNLQLTTQPLLLLLPLILCSEVILMETVGAAELPAELMLESVALLKSMEHAQQQQQQQHHYSEQKEHMLHEQAKRFPFATLNSVNADVGIDDMQLPEMSPADIARFERELFLQSAIDETSLAAADDMELPLEADSMEQHADLMERAIDYQQHQPTTMWLQQHGSSVGDGMKAGSAFLKLHHPNKQQQHQQQLKHQQQHRLSGDTAAANSVTLAPPPMPVAVPQRQCAFEISTQVTGVCQAMVTVGTACVAGEYMDVYNQDCM